MGKVCSRCGECKPARDFYVWKRAKNGLTSDCKECRRAYERTRRAGHPERDAEIKRAYYQRNKAAYAERVRRWRAENAERFARTARAWLDAHPGYSTERGRRERLRNPQSGAERSARRRARRLDNGVVPYQRADIYERDGGLCHLCGEKTDPETFTLDHLIPIARGGPDAPTNVAVAHLNCNQRRGLKPLADMRRTVS